MQRRKFDIGYQRNYIILYKFLDVKDCDRTELEYEKKVTRITLSINFRHLCSCETSIQNGPNFPLFLYKIVLIKELNLLCVNSDITVGETNKMTQMTQNMAEN